MRSISYFPFLISVFTVILLLLAPQSVDAQCEKDYKRKFATFQDYSKCFTGIVLSANRKDTIYPAVLESVKFRTGRSKGPIRYYAWFVEITQEGKYGILNCEGEELVPPKCDTVKFDYQNWSYQFWKNGKVGFVNAWSEKVIEATYDELNPIYTASSPVLVAHKGKKIGLIDSTGAEVIPFKYDSIVTINPMPTGRKKNKYLHEPRKPAEAYVKVYKKGKAGVYNHLGELVVPLNYDDVSILELEGSSNSFWKVASQGKVGVLNLVGEEIVAQKFVDASAIQAYIAGVQRQIFIVLQHDGEDQSIVDTAGTVLSTDVQGKVKAFAWYCDSTKVDNVFYVIGKNREGECAYLLDGSGTKTKRYKKLEDTCEGLVFETLDGNSGMLNQKFELIYECNSCYVIAPSVNNLYDEIPTDDPYSQHRLFTHVKEGGRTELIGLVTGQGKQIVPPKYRDLEVVSDSNGYYIWVFDGDVSALQIVKVFDSEGNMKEQKLYDFTYQAFNDYIYEIDRQYSLYFAENIDHKTGGLALDGDAVIPFEYDAYERTIFDTLGQIYAYEMRKGRKVHLVNPQGKLVFPDKYDDVYLNIISGYHRVKYGDTYSLLDSNGKVVFEGANSMKFASTGGYSYHFRETERWMDRARYGRKLVAKKDGTTYRFIDGEFVADQKPANVGTTLTADGQKLMDASGRVVSQAWGNWYWKDNIWVSNSQYDFRVHDSNGKELIRLQDATPRRGYGDYIYIVHNRLEGLISTKTGEWVIPLKYHFIIKHPLQFKGTDHFWVKTTPPNKNASDGAVGGWKLTDANKARRIPYFLLYPFQASVEHTVIFATKQGWGLIEPDLNIVVEPAYEYIHKQSEGVFILHKEGNWRVYHEKYGMLKDSFNNVNLHADSLRLIVHQLNGADTLMGMLNFSKGLDYEIPLMTPNTFLDSLGVSETNNWVGEQPTMLLANQEFGEFYIRNPNNYKSLDRLNKALNYRKLLRSSMNMTEHSTTFGTLHGNSSWVCSRDLGIPIRKYFKPTQVSMPYNSCWVLQMGKNTLTMRFQNWVKNDKGRTVSKVEDINFIITPNELIEVELEDLFKSKADWREFIRQRLSQLANETQAFGANCVNLPEKINELMEKWMLGSEGIRFIVRGHGISSFKTLDISYQELKEYLKKDSPLLQ